jgi:hypothetical protein
MNAPEIDCLDKKWCCLTCSAVFPLGKMRLDFACIKCGGLNTHPADKDVVVLEKYEGDRGTLN